MIEWKVEAEAFSNCNCDYSCPCQFELRPTQGDCRGVEVGRILHGRFAEVSLDGLCWAVVYAWPGPIFEGNGVMQAVIDERADARQRDALVTILHGGETEEAKTHWWVFRAMSSEVHEPLFKPIEFEVDIAARAARARIPGMLEGSGRPIVSPATGEHHRVQICHPEGIEFERAEIGSGSTRADGPIALALTDRYGQFNLIRHGNRGVIRG